MKESSSNKKQFWHFLINGHLDENTGAYANFYTYGSHLGESLSRTIDASSQIDLSNVDVIEAARLDTIKGFKLPGGTEALTEYVKFKDNLTTYDLDENEYQFIAPTGIVKSSDDSEYDYDLITEKFVAYGKSEEGIFELELVVDKKRLIETFIETIDFLPTVDSFWIYIQNHWDDAETELWVAKHFGDKKAVVNFLTSNKTSTLENGFIDCVVHSLAGQTNLTLDEHKKIQLHTKDERLFDHFGKKIMGLGFEQTRDFYSLEFGYHHWHYRPGDSLGREAFKELLSTNGFDHLDSRE